jgi:hypothetical protein
MRAGIKIQQSLRLGVGFTLAEVAISIAVVAVGLLAVIGLAITATGAASEVRQTDAAWRVRSTVERDLSGAGERFETIYEALRTGVTLYALVHGVDSTGVPEEPFHEAEEIVPVLLLENEVEFPAVSRVASEVFRVEVALHDPESGNEVAPADLPLVSFVAGSSGPQLLPWYEARVELFQLPSGLDLTGGGAALPAGKRVCTFHTIVRP